MRNPLRTPEKGDVIRCKDDDDGCSFIREVLYADKHTVWWQRDGVPRESTLKNFKAWAKGGKLIGCMSMTPTNGDKTFTLEVNEYQLQVLRQALDNYARMGMGQLEVSVDEFLRQHFYEQYGEGIYEEFPVVISNRVAVANLIYTVKKIVFGHPPHGSWGINNKKVPKACREAYDIRQIVGQALNKARRARGEEGVVDIDDLDYLATNRDDPPIKITEKT